MAKRGRPPYPDVLTPREWEVHALLREGLSNGEIAGRLGISVAGAKYHVSEILGKLGVESRAEAAAWTREQRPWWQAGIAPVAALWRRASASWLSIGATAVVAIAIAAGIGLLAWGLARTDGGGGPADVGIIGPPSPAQRISFAAGEEINVAPGVFYVDLDTGAVEGWWGFRPGAISPDGRFVFYDEQRYIDTGSGAVCVVSEQSGPVTFSPDSSRFVANWAGGAAVFPTECGEAPTALDVPEPGRLGKPAWSAGAAWSSDGTMVLLHVTGVGGSLNPKEPPQALYLADLAEGTVQEIPSRSQAAASEFAWAPEGREFALTIGPTVSRIGPDGEPIWSIDVPADGARNPQFSPDGGLLFVHGDFLGAGDSRATYAAYILNAQTGELVKTFEGVAYCWGNPWTADGARLALSSTEPGYELVGIDGSVEAEAALSVRPFFAEPSPREPDIVAYLDRGFVGGVSGPLTVWDSDSGELTPVASFATDAQPDWDPQHGRRWLTDGRLVLITGWGGHGGCGLGPP